MEVRANRSIGLGGSSLNQQQTQAISRAGVDAAFEADEARKSSLILEAQLLRDRRAPDEAARRFAEAAQIEESLSQRCAAQGLTEKSFLHCFSALRRVGAGRRLLSGDCARRRIACISRCGPNVCASEFRHIPIRSAFDALIGMKNWRWN